MKRNVAIILLVFVTLFSVFAEENNTDRPTVALVLSGGGAKGISHIPIIEALESKGIPIDKVFGTSIGALVGGLYSAGYSPSDMREVVLSDALPELFTVLTTSGYTEVLDAFNYHSNNVFSLSLSQGVGGVNGLIDDYMILNFLSDCIGNVPDYVDFDTDLAIPFECNATDMVTGNEICFTEGSLLTAMRSSMSIPVAFEAVETDGMVLTDGGLSCNTMVQKAIDEGYDIIICIDLGGRKSETDNDVESLRTLSGISIASFSLILRNVSGDDVDKATFVFEPDTRPVGTLDFGKAAYILEIGEEEVADKAAMIDEIAALFTEEQKVYKNPNRKGEYFSMFEQKEKTGYQSASSSRHEDLLGRTRISFGLYGSAGLGYYLSEGYDSSRYVLSPTVSFRSYIKDIGGTNFSLDIRFKTTSDKNTELSTKALYKFNLNGKENLYTAAKIGASLGSFTIYTSRQGDFSFNSILEKEVYGDIGLTFTNEQDHSITIYASADNLWTVPTKSASGLDLIYRFMPRIAFEGVFYPSYSNGLFGSQGSRFDLIGSVEYDTYQSQWGYQFGISGRSSLPVNERISFKFDATAFTARGDSYMARNYMQYGGWNGMPGYTSDIQYTDFIYGGAEMQILLSKGILSDFLSIVVRGGVRSIHQYNLDTLIFEGSYKSYLPFADCFDKPYWDLGVAIGFGLNTPVGDIVIGSGYNLRNQLTFFVEIV